MEAGFRNDPSVIKIAEAYSLDAVDIAERNFGISLDSTESSIEAVERLLAKLHDQMGSAKPDEKVVWSFAKAFGSYIGEVYRKYHGGAWGIVELGGEEFPGIQSANGVRFWPWSRVYKRLVDGAENNVWHYYQSMTASA